MANELHVGDLLRNHDGHRAGVEVLCNSGEDAPVYDLRTAEYHTYFVGSQARGLRYGRMLRVIR